MKQYIIKRILSAIPLLIIISFVCFVFINLIPSDPAEVALRIRQVPIITEEAVAQVRAELGLDKPYLIRYISWLADCLRGRFWNQLCQSEPYSCGRTDALSSGDSAACGCIVCDGSGTEHSDWSALCRL